MSERNPADQPLREALEALERSAPAAPVPPLATAPGRRRWQLMLAPTAVTLVVGILIGAMVTQWLLSSRGVGSPTPRPSASAGTAVMTDVTWEVTPFPPGPAFLSNLSVVGDRIVVLGAGPSGESSVAAWYSDDGVAFTAATIDTAGIGPAGMQGIGLAKIAWSNGVGVALGSDGRALFRSTDSGATWTHLPQQRLDGAGSVIGGWSGGFLAAGLASGAATDTTFAPRLWTSADGSTWTAVPGPASMGGANIAAFAAHGSTMVLVGGHAGVSGTPSSLAPAAWWSQDGTHWAAATFATSPAGAILLSVAATADGFVAGDSAGRLWRSVDGAAWTAAAVAPGTAAYLAIDSLAAGPGGVVGTGYDPGVTTFAPQTVLFPAGGDARQLQVPGGAGIAGLSWWKGQFVGIAACGPLESCQGGLLLGTPVYASTPNPSLSATPSSSSTVAPTEPAGTAEPPPTPAPLALADGWSYKLFGQPPTQDGPDQASTVSVVGGQVMVAGNRPSEGVVWVLGANGAWAETGHLQGEESLGNYQIQRIAPSSGLLVAAGTRYAIDYAIPEIWWSTDGTGSWTEAVGPLSTSSICGQITDLTTTASGFLAVGYTCNPPGGPVSTSEALLFSSPDGHTWSHRTIPGTDDGGLDGVASNGSRIVAIGFRGTNTLVLTSDDDGATWTERTLPPVDGNASVRRIIVGPDGFAILGYVSQPGHGLETVPEVWTSADGTNWSMQVVDSSMSFPVDIVRTDGGYAIVGEHLSDTGSQDVLLWTSPDLRSWSGPTQVATGHLMSAIGMAWTGDRLVIVGQDSPAEATFSRPMSLIHAGSLP